MNEHTAAEEPQERAPVDADVEAAIDECDKMEKRLVVDHVIPAIQDVHSLLFGCRKVIDALRAAEARAEQAEGERDKACNQRDFFEGERATAGIEIIKLRDEVERLRIAESLGGNAEALSHYRDEVERLQKRVAEVERLTEDNRWLVAQLRMFRENGRCHWMTLRGDEKAPNAQDVEIALSTILDVDDALGGAGPLLVDAFRYEWTMSAVLRAELATAHERVAELENQRLGW